MKLASYLGLLGESERSLAAAFRQVADRHGDEPDVRQLTQQLATWSDQHAEALEPFVQQYGERDDAEPGQLRAAELGGDRTGGVALLRDLQDLYALAGFVEITWTVIGQAAQGLRDRDLLAVVHSCDQQTTRQLTWLTTRIKQAAPQALLTSG